MKLKLVIAAGLLSLVGACVAGPYEGRPAYYNSGYNGGYNGGYYNNNSYNNGYYRNNGYDRTYYNGRTYE